MQKAKRDEMQVYSSGTVVVITAQWWVDNGGGCVLA
jgi:hypothetical protein